MEHRPVYVAAIAAVSALAITFSLVAKSGATDDHGPAVVAMSQQEWVEPDTAQTKLPDGREITISIDDHWDTIHAMEDADRPPPGSWYHYRYDRQGELARSEICHYVPATPEYAAAAASQLVKAGLPERPTYEVEQCTALESFNR